MKMDRNSGRYVGDPAQFLGGISTSDWQQVSCIKVNHTRQILPKPFCGNGLK